MNYPGDSNMPYRDPHNIHEFIRAVLAMMTLISGGIGGGLIGARHMVRNKLAGLALVVAYALVGSGIGFGVFAVSPFLPGLEINSFSDAALVGFIAGVAGTIALAAGNIAIKFSAKKLGIDEATITVKMTGDDEIKATRTRRRKVED